MAKPAVKLRALREAKGLNKQELSVLAGVHPKTIARYETGTTTPKLIVLVRLAYALECQHLSQIIEDEWLDWEELPGRRPMRGDTDYKLRL